MEKNQKNLSKEFKESRELKETKESKETLSKNAENEALAGKVSAVSIAGNVFLSAFKFIAGVLGHSSAMVSDAVHSLSDVITTVIALIGVKIAKRGADAGHPYGHERFECVSSIILSGLLLATGLGIGMTGMKTILSGDYADLAIPGVLPLAAAIVSIVSKEAMFWYTRSCAQKMHSSVFMADAWHHRSDALSSIGSLIGVAGARAGFPVLDSVASVVICLFILKVAVDIFRDAVRKLTDTACDENYTEQVRAYIARQEGVRRIDLLQTRMFGEKVYVDVEIAVDAHMDLEDAHAIAERVHTGLENTFDNIKHVMVHVNPYVSS
ncbi:MAG: cation diffusion facilitator family transporter [Lachnospiraceae bacterium]|nr:cation diffusion facilitator family transporter [Lachnospiraceae bacterium]